MAWAILAALLGPDPDVTPAFGAFHPELVDQIRAIRITGGRPVCLAVNADGTTAALGTGQRLLLVDLEKGELRRSDKDVAVTSAAFGRGEVLALGLKGRVELRRGPALDQKSTVEIPALGAILQVAFSPSGRLLAAADAASVVVVDVGASTVSAKVVHGGKSEASVVLGFDAAERQVMVVTSDGQMTLLEAATGRSLQAAGRMSGLKAGAAVSRPAVEPSSGQVALVMDRPQRGRESKPGAFVLDPLRGRFDERDRLPPDEPLVGLLFAGGGTCLIGHSIDELRIWNQEGAIRRSVAVLAGTLQFAAVAPEGERIVTAGVLPLGGSSEGAVMVRVFGVRTEAAPRPGFLGVRYEGTAARVVRVPLETAAWRALIAPGDTIVSIGGRAVKSGKDAQEAERSFKEGDTVEVEFIHEGERVKEQVRLGGLIE